MRPSSDAPMVLDLQPGNLDATCSDGPAAPHIPCDGRVDEACEVAACGIEVDHLRPVVLPATRVSTVRVRDTSAATEVETTCFQSARDVRRTSCQELRSDLALHAPQHAIAGRPAAGSWLGGSPRSMSTDGQSEHRNMLVGTMARAHVLAASRYRPRWTLQDIGRLRENRWYRAIRGLSTWHTSTR